MRKSLHILSASTLMILLSQTAFANMAYKGERVYKDQPPCPVQMLAKGFYLGAGVGYDSYRVRSTFSTDILAGAVGYAFSTGNDLSATGWVGKLFVGYDLPIDLWSQGNLGIEAFFSRSNADGTENYNLLTGSAGITTTATGQNKVEVRNSYGISLLPGYHFTPATMTFLRLGWTRTQFELSNNSTVTGTAIVIPTGTVATSLTQRQYRNGWTLGFGMETLLVDNWSLRGEFDHTWYQSSSFNGALATGVKASNSEGMVSVVYHFI